MTIDTTPKTIEKILQRGTAEVISSDNLKNKLTSGKKLKVKLYLDPTTDNLHLGHAVVLRKVRHFQDAGHQVILVVGNFSEKVADLGSKQKKRQLTDDEVAKNVNNYLDQARKVLDTNTIEIAYDSDWLDNMSLREVVALADHFTMEQFLEQDQDGKTGNKTTKTSEFFAPLMQGYDSVVLRADVEIGSSEKKFHCLAGKVLQEAIQEPAQSVVLTPSLTGWDGEVMGKTGENTIGLNEPATKQFSKIMSIPDHLIISYFELLTDLPATEITEIEQGIKAGKTIRESKIKLARAIVSTYHDQEAATYAESQFHR